MTDYQPIWFSRYSMFSDANGNRNYAKERQREKLKEKSRNHALPHFINQPQPDLTPWEVDEPATADYFEAQAWIDDTHRFRCLWKLRRMDFRHQPHPDDPESVTHGNPYCDRWQGYGQKPEQSKKWNVKECAAWWQKRKITRNRVDVAFLKSRCRPLDILADEGFALLCQYDHAIRTGEGDAAALSNAINLLLEEANGGTRFGIGVRYRPNALRTLWKWKARQAGKLPMFGIEQRFRFECRGLHLIACTRFGLGIHIDHDKHRPGDLCHSSTGYRSFGISEPWSDFRGSPVDWAREVLEHYIDTPNRPKNSSQASGLGGRYCECWMPTVVEYWHSREKGEKWRDDLADHYNKLADQGRQLMASKGVDPYTLFLDLKPAPQMAFGF